MTTTSKIFRNRQELAISWHNVLLEDTMMKKRWTQNELSFLKKNLQLMTIQEIAGKLGRTKHGVSGKLRRLYGVNLDRKSPKSANRYNMNIDKLHTKSDELFYLLGFIAADGNVSRNSNTITIRLSWKDKRLLEDIKNWLEYTGPIRREVQNGYIRSESAVLYITNRHLKDTLLHYGIGPNKSKTIRLLNPMSDEFAGSFIRGVFDGDGSVCKSKDNHFVIYICSSSMGFLEDLQKLMGFGKISTNKNKMHLLYIRSYEKRSFFELMYDNSNLHLSRKYKRMKESYEYVVRQNWKHRERNNLGQFAGKRV